MRTPFDQRAKDLLEPLVRPYAEEVVREREVASDPQYVDLAMVWKVSASVDDAFEKLGWLGRMIGSSERCLLEPFSEAVSVDEARGCHRKQLNYHHQLQLDAARATADEATTAVEFPLLWIISAGDPRTAIGTFKLRARSEWPPGFEFDSEGHGMCVVVLGRLERRRETLSLRILGRGRVWEQALEDFRALPEDDPLKRPLLGTVARRHVVGLDSKDEREAAMTEQEFQKFEEQLRNEGKQLGLRGVVQRQLTKRFGPLDEAALAQLEAADTVSLECFADRVLTAKSLAEVFAD